jgi:DNA-binding response OmpR family regulator
MRLLLAEDNVNTRMLLASTLQEWGYEVLAVADGADAWRLLQNDNAPDLVVMDWTMPGMSGLEVCRRIREGAKALATFIIMVTARSSTEDLIAGFEAGADEYVVKPFDLAELRVRVQAGARTVDLQNKLAARVKELEEALSRVKRLHELLPICTRCKRIRDDHAYRQQVEAYIGEHSEVEFCHSVCPDCTETLRQPDVQRC